MDFALLGIYTKDRPLTNTVDVVNLLDGQSQVLLNRPMIQEMPRTYRSKDTPIALGNPTVCVSGLWAGVDFAWMQEKPETRKMLENAAESHPSGARFVERSLLRKARWLFLCAHNQKPQSKPKFPNKTNRET
jgi:hypothetical protein